RLFRGAKSDFLEPEFEFPAAKPGLTLRAKSSRPTKKQNVCSTDGTDIENSKSVLSVPSVVP
ncbi:MAG TPA: hypothetical protein VMV10_09795, partial [Pirellulales bacterium]|nr:hypothetical protein [Pirellulales bacterium]